MAWRYCSDCGNQVRHQRWDRHQEKHHPGRVDRRKPPLTPSPPTATGASSSGEGVAALVVMAVFIGLVGVIVHGSCQTARMATARRAIESNEAVPTCSCEPADPRIRDLATKLAGALGSRLVAGGVDAALVQVLDHLPEPWSRGENVGSMTQHSERDGAYSAAFLIGCIGCVDLGELEQFYAVHGQTEWAVTDQGCLKREFTGTVQGTNVRVVQQRHGNPAWLNSTYSWSQREYWGKGSDQAIPVYDAGANAQAYVALSKYDSLDPYRTAADAQREAVHKWRRNVEEIHATHVALLQEE